MQAKTNNQAPNYQKAFDFATKHGYELRDISYNGIIYLSKIINDSKIEIQIYDGIIKDREPKLKVQTFEPNLESLSRIFEETKYCYYNTIYHHSLSDTWRNLTMDNIFEYALFLENNFKNHIYQ